MYRKNLSITILAFLLISSISIIAQPIRASSQSTGMSRSFDARLTLVLQSNVSSTIPEAYFSWTLTNASWAKTYVKKADPELLGYGYFDCEINQVPKDDPNGFCATVWMLKNVEPGDVVEVNLWFSIEAEAFQPSTLKRDNVGTLNNVPSELQTYTSEAYLWDYSNSSVQNVINEINSTIQGSKNVYDIVWGTINWFSTHFNYAYPDEFDYPSWRVKASQILNQTLKQTGKHYGVCRHMADAFTAIMRGFGVPCKYQTGMIFYNTQRTEYGADGIIFLGLHAWVVVYLPQIGWIPVDVTVPDKYTRDIVRVGVIPYPYYYVPDYIEYTNSAPEPYSSETFNQFLTIGGTITAEPKERVDIVSLIITFGPWIICGLLAIFTIYSVYHVRTLRRKVGEPARLEVSFCPNCGEKLPPGALFCGKCGQRIRESA